eukprot:Skav204664  [mRNA]  locus=scaffold607:67937:73430:- [translate_table: standard]
MHRCPRKPTGVRLLALDTFVVLACFAEVVLFSISPDNALALRLLRPLRGLRLLRAARGCMRVIRRSERANLALSAFEKSGDLDGDRCRRDLANGFRDMSPAG